MRNPKPLVARGIAITGAAAIICGCGIPLEFPTDTNPSLDPCGQGPVASITIAPVPVLVSVGGETLPTYHVKNASGGTMGCVVLERTVRNPAIATVTGEGLVRGVAAGQTIIVARYELIVDSAIVVVQ